MLRVGIASDHGGFALKAELTASLRAAGYEIEDYGAYELALDDDYPDFIIPWRGRLWHSATTAGWPLCKSGVGESVAANKIPGVRAGLIHDVFSAHQGVEDDDMNVFCLGGKVVGSAFAAELIETFLRAPAALRVTDAGWR